MPAPPQRLPDPAVAPPGSRPLTQEEAAVARRAVHAAERGDAAGARALAARLPAGHPVRELVELEIRFLLGGDVAAPARALAASLPSWAAAWHLAAVASEREGDLAGALDSARRGAALPGDPAALSSLVRRLETTLVAVTVTEARALLDHGEAAAALERAERALELVSAASELRIVAADAALAAGRRERAAELLPALPDSPDGLVVKGKVAAALGQWDLAVAFFERLPADVPGRCALLRDARLSLRLANAPPNVAKALQATALTRRGLASLVVWEVPEVSRFAQGAVPVYEDIVDLPERADILTVARAGVLRGDAVARRFGPQRQVSAREAAAVVERVAALLGQPAPRWCGEGETGEPEGCVRLAVPVSGREVAEILRRIAEKGGDACR